MKIISLIFILINFVALSIEKQILVFDLINNTIDTMPIVNFDRTKEKDQTEFYVGEYNNEIETLEQTPPILNVFQNSRFTLKKKLFEDYDLNRFPIRTSVIIKSVINDTLKQLCSGSLIGDKYVLTAAHCISDINKNKLKRDSIVVYPVFNDGIQSKNFDSARVIKVYKFKDWNLTTDDFLILELEKPIGIVTGWISIGYDKNNDRLKEHIYYKFTYPGRKGLGFDTTVYSGDFLYYNYGKLNIVEDNSFGISSGFGVQGESGSSLIEVVNNYKYTSYGVLSTAIQLNHSRIKDWQFYSFKEIMNNNMTPVSMFNKGHIVRISPNPINDYFYLEPGNQIQIARLIDVFGRVIQQYTNIKRNVKWDTSLLSPGTYFLEVKYKSKIEVIKVIKQN